MSKAAGSNRTAALLVRRGAAVGLDDVHPVGLADLAKGGGIQPAGEKSVDLRYVADADGRRPLELRAIADQEAAAGVFDDGARDIDLDRVGVGQRFVLVESRDRSLPCRL